MRAYPTSKKSRLVEGDWHPADVVCELRKAGWSLRKLSKHHGYADSSTLKNALHRSWPKAERLIAEAIGVDPASIWPSRYAARAGQKNCGEQTGRWARAEAARRAKREAA